MEDDQELWADGPGLIASLARYRWTIAALTLFAAVAAYALSAQQPTVYSASSQVLFSDPRDPGLLGSADAARLVDPERYFPLQAERVTAPDILEAAATDLGGEFTVESLRRDVIASADVDSNLVSITSEASTPESAAEIANAVAFAFEVDVAAGKQQEAERAISAVENQIVELREQAETAGAAAAEDPEDTIIASRARILTERIIAMEGQTGEIAAQAAVEGSGIEAVNEAVPPRDRTSPNPVRDAALAGMLMFMLSGAGAYWLAGRDDSIQSSSEPASILAAPLLGEVPLYRSPPTRLSSGQLSVPPAAAEAFQFILSSIDYALPDSTSATVLISSAAAGEGKTVSALQLALAARRDGREVTLVDGDLRARGLTTLLGAQESLGLSHLAEGSVSQTQATKRYRLDNDIILPVVTAGAQPGDPSGIVRSAGFKSALQRTRETTPLIVLDTPPILAVVDASLMAAQSDGIVLVVTPDTSPRSLRKIKERLAFVDTPVLGYIYNRATQEMAHYNYGYSHENDRKWRNRFSENLKRPSNGRSTGSERLDDRPKSKAMLTNRSTGAPS